MTNRIKCSACSKSVKVLKDGTLAQHGWSERRRGGRTNTVQLTPACAASGTLATFSAEQLAGWLAIEPMLTTLVRIWRTDGTWSPFAHPAHVANNLSTAARLRSRR